MNEAPTIQWSVKLPPLQDSVLRYYAWLHGKPRAWAIQHLLVDFAQEYFDAESFNEFVESELLPKDNTKPQLHQARVEQVEFFLRGIR